MHERGADGTIALGDVRLGRRLRVGEPAAFQILWLKWRDQCWSVCSAMSHDRAESVALLGGVYTGLPGVFRGHPGSCPLCCLVAGHVYSVVQRNLELPPLGGIGINVPSAVDTPDSALAARRVAAMSPNLRLVYLVDLFFGCPAANTAALTGANEDDVRAARSTAAWSVVSAGGER
jgi:hypothetical protein